MGLTATPPPCLQEAFSEVTEASRSKTADNRTISANLVIDSVRPNRCRARMPSFGP
jgi:hypothetical protein